MLKEAAKPMMGRLGSRITVPKDRPAASASRPAGGPLPVQVGWTTLTAYWNGSASCRQTVPSGGRVPLIR
jgi:hypothetical protein